MSERKTEPKTDECSEWFEYGYGYAFDLLSDELLKEIEASVEKAVKDYFYRKRNEYVR